ncbi:MAG: thioredoxin domain-containing protein [Rhizomicrobium sp.]
MNRLATETSPYLLQHKDDAVAWYPWGPEALAAAQAQNKPIHLSIGYSACHWCQVMGEESFSDPQTAAVLNAEYINILVDREERPDVDQVYQAAANLMGNAGGWPLTIFLDTARVPFFVGTYFPKEERAGLAPPLSRVLGDLRRLREERAADLTTASENIKRELTSLWHRDMRGPIDANTLDSAAIRIAQRFDIFFGGVVGQQNKFPSATQLEVLWRAFLRTGMGQFMQVVSTTMDNILLGGLCDHVGGGFYRYCVDERWLVPHFEKTLVDNAQILELITGLWQFNRNPLCAARAAETVEFLLRDLKNGAAFAAGISSDSEGQTGKYYLWSEAEVDAALAGTFIAKFKAAYNVVRDGAFNGKNVLQRLGSPAPFPQPEADEALLAKQRSLLLKARQGRTPPPRDDKVLADWNGIAIAALANAGSAFEQTAWVQAAIEAFEFVVKTMGDGDRLYHSWIGGKRGARGFADDYAHMARAAIALYEAVGDKRYLDQARRWTRVLNEQFWDKERGGYLFTAEDGESMIVRARMVFDQPAPSANATMIKVLTCLMMATGDASYSERLNQLVGAFAGEAQRAFISMGAYFSGLEFGMSGLQLVVIGPLNHPKTHELTAAILGRALPNRFLTVLAPDDAFPEGHPMHGRGMQNGQPTAYVVQRGQVSAPVTNPVTLSQMLQLPPPRPQPGQRPQ